jgi:hypothetical protein
MAQREKMSKPRQDLHSNFNLPSHLPVSCPALPPTRGHIPGQPLPFDTKISIVVSVTRNLKIAGLNSCFLEWDLPTGALHPQT